MKETAMKDKSTFNPSVMASVDNWKSV